MIDWSTCPAVERSPERVGGAWTFRGTRLPVAALFDNLAAGATVPEFLECFPGATPGQVDAVLAHASRSAGAGAPVPTDDDLDAEIRRRPERYRADPGSSRSLEEVRRAGYEASRRAVGAPGFEGATGAAGTRPFDAARHLVKREDAAACLEAALEDGDAAIIAAALADIARSKASARAPLEPDARGGGRSESSAGAGGPALATLLAVTKALGLKLRVRPASDDGPPRPGPIPPAREAVGSNTSGSVISRDPEVMGGTPAFAGTRVPIVAAFDYLESGDSVENFLDDFPGVSHGQLIEMLKLARVSLLGPDEPVVRRTDPDRLPRKVRYGGRELEAVPANGVTGMLLSSFDRTWTFRVTHADGTLSDYRLRHDDMTVTIADDELAAFCTDGDKIGILDHSPEVLGLVPEAPRTVIHTERRPPPTDGCEDDRDVGREILDGIREIRAFERGEGPTLRSRRLREFGEPVTERPDDGPTTPPEDEPPGA